MLPQICDRCKQSLDYDNESLRDYLDREYFPRNICKSCDHQIFLSSALTTEDCLRNQPSGTALKKLLDIYCVEENIPLPQRFVPKKIFCKPFV